MKSQWDVFVCHASEDKAEFVDALVDALRSRGLEVWYDAGEIQLGDDFRVKMDDGLRGSRFGVVVVSPSFWKYWTQAELSAFFNQERTSGEKHILPVRHRLRVEELTALSPLLAGRASAGSEQGPEAVADAIYAAVRGGERGAERRGSSLYNAPETRAANFVGRDADLGAVEHLLGEGRDVRVAASVEGLAGVGKTELALQLAFRLAARGVYPGGIFWLDAEKPNLETQWGGSIAEALALPAMALAERAELAVRTVSRSDRPVLVVLDNVAVWTNQDHPKPIPSGPHVHLLVTSRRASLGGARFAHHHLDFLSAGACRQLACALAGRDLTQAGGFDDLIAYLGGHALATELAGAWLGAFPDESPAAYLRLLEAGDEPDRDVAPQVRYEKTVGQAFRATWDRLDDDARTGWRIAARFEPEEASVALLTACGVGASAQRALREFHVIESAEGRWRMHRLTREFGRRAEHGSAADVERSFVRGCGERAREIDLDTGFRVYVPDQAHFDAAVARAPEVLSDDPSAMSALLDRVATARQSLGAFRSAQTLFEQALTAALKQFGEDHPAVATRRSNLGVVLQDLGELPRARELLEQALAADLKQLGEDHPAVATSRSNLAGVLQYLGELPRARELMEQALAADLKQLGEDHPAVARSRSNLAGVLKDLGELPRARELMEQALAASLKQLGEDHPTVATHRFNLAMICSEEGDDVAARSLLEATLASELQSLGGDNPLLAYMRANLADVLHRLGETARARQEAHEALRVVATQPDGSRYRVAVERIAGSIAAG